jgi:glycosyltransferase involved in cell wall biosynthesis
MSRLLVIAFACEPGQGSEPGIGWNIASRLAEEHDVTVITHPLHQRALDDYLLKHPELRLTVHYCAMPALEWCWVKNSLLNVYYYLWQFKAARLVRRLHAEQAFDAVQHATYGRYWMPSAADRLGIPMVWGPVGGGENSPAALRSELGWKGGMLERIRDGMRAVFELDPLLRRTVRAATVGLAATEETATRMRSLGVQEVRVFSNAGHDVVIKPQPLGSHDDRPIRLICVARLLAWKGFGFAIRAFAQAKIPGATLTIVGTGPDENRLRSLARTLGVDDSVRFTGGLERQRCLQEIANSHVLVHPSLHDSGGIACVEAMALGRPVVCLRLGGPGVIVDDSSGIRIPPADPETVVRSLGEAFVQLHSDRHRLAALSSGAAARAAEFHWSHKMAELRSIYRSILSDAVASASERKVQVLQPADR